MNFVDLYEEQDLRVLKDAEDSLNPKIDRVQEIIAYAKQARLKKIGIAHCTTFNKEADILESVLVNEGFEVAKVNCKYGRVPFNDLVPGYRGVSCNPAGQAQYLEENKTELNMVLPRI